MISLYTHTGIFYLALWILSWQTLFPSGARPINLFLSCPCVRAWWQKKCYLTHFQRAINLMQALAAKHSAGSAHAERYPSVGNSSPCYGKCVREVPPKIRGLERDLFRTLLATASMASATCAHDTLTTTQVSRMLRHVVGSHIACNCRCGHFFGGRELAL